MVRRNANSMNRARISKSVTRKTLESKTKETLKTIGKDWYRIKCVGMTKNP